ncbi:MAG: hypothetical protein ABSA04_02785 [Desulfobaccales bacterium]|jgi:hypothetical protein
MSPEELEAEIRLAAPQGNIPCAAAFRLAEELSISTQEMGKLLNELGIKIKLCQLGCF